MKYKGAFRYLAVGMLVILYYLNSTEDLSLSQDAKLFPAKKSIDNKSEINVCTQNIFRLGDKGTDTGEFNTQLGFLVDRIKEAECSVIALQEVAGNTYQSKEILSRLSAGLNKRIADSEFKDVLGPSNDPFIRNAFIYNANILKLVNSRSLYHDSIPRLSSRSAPWSYVRGPLMAEFSMEDKGTTKPIVLINYHLKSKSRGYKDKAGLDFEISRLLSAGGIRERIDEFMRSKRKDYVEVLLGDRNADSDSATSKVLSGELAVDDFRGETACEVIKTGEALCSAEHYASATFDGVLQKKNQVESLSLSTHNYRGKESILDEIYISHEDFDRTQDINSQIRAGVVGGFNEGSDHLLSWVRIRLN